MEEKRTPIDPDDALQRLGRALGSTMLVDGKFRWVLPCDDAPGGILIVTAGRHADPTAAEVTIHDWAGSRTAAEVTIVIRSLERLQQVVSAIRERMATQGQEGTAVKPEPRVSESASERQTLSR